MPSVIEVKEKTVNNRDVISFSKVYADEEHEVFAPKEHAVQVLLQLLAVINADKPDDDRFLLVRKGQLGDGDVEPVDAELLKREVVANIAATLFDTDAAMAVGAALRDDAGRRWADVEPELGVDRDVEPPLEPEAD